MGLFPKHLQCIAHLMIELSPSIVHPVQTDFACAPSSPWRLQCSSLPQSIHLTLGWLYRFSTTPDAMVVRDSHKNQDFREIVFRPRDGKLEPLWPCAGSRPGNQPEMSPSCRSNRILLQVLPPSYVGHCRERQRIAFERVFQHETLSGDAA